MDGEEVPGGTAAGISYEVGSKQLLTGLDEAIEGKSAGDATTYSTPLVGGDFAGRDADVAVTVRSVKERKLPELDDDFAQLASEFDTLDELRDDLSEKLTRSKQMEQLYAARNKALEALVAAVEVPVPEGVVADEVDHRKQAMTDQLERMGSTLEVFLSAEDKTEEQLDTELTETATEVVRNRLVLDALADDRKTEVSDDEFAQEVMMRAQEARVAPQQYYDQLVRSGMAGSVHGDVRRGKALASILEQVKIKDSAGNTVDLEALRGELQAAAAASAAAATEDA